MSHTLNKGGRKPNAWGRSKWVPPFFDLRWSNIFSRRSSGWEQWALQSKTNLKSKSHDQGWKKTFLLSRCGDHWFKCATFAHLEPSQHAQHICTSGVCPSKASTFPSLPLLYFLPIKPHEVIFAQACRRTWYICPTKTKVEFHYQLANFEFSTFTNTTEIRCFWKVFMPYFLLPHRPSKYCKVSLLPSPSESLGALRRARKTLQWREDVAQPSGHRNCHHKEGKTT